MILFPAIDLYGGKVVRLSEGNFAKKTEYSVTALDAAKKFRDAGCSHIHVVDLEGAERGRPCHLRELRQIAAIGMFVQYGGGLRSADAVGEAVDAGAGRVMTGSLLFKDRDTPRLLVERFGSAVMPAVDVKGGLVVAGGWLEATGRTPGALIKELNLAGCRTFLVTDTERDGLLRGVRLDFYEPLLGEGYEIVAAGGITSAADLAGLAALGLGGAVVGKSLYEGGVTVEEAIKAAAGGAFDVHDRYVIDRI